MRATWPVRGVARDPSGVLVEVLDIEDARKIIDLLDTGPFEENLLFPKRLHLEDVETLVPVTDIITSSFLDRLQRPSFITSYLNYLYLSHSNNILPLKRVIMNDEQLSLNTLDVQRLRIDAALLLRQLPRPRPYPPGSDQYLIHLCIQNILTALSQITSMSSLRRHVSHPNTFGISEQTGRPLITTINLLTHAQEVIGGPEEIFRESFAPLYVGSSYISSLSFQENMELCPIHFLAALNAFGMLVWYIAASALSKFILARSFAINLREATLYQVRMHHRKQVHSVKAEIVRIRGVQKKTANIITQIEESLSLFPNTTTSLKQSMKEIARNIVQRREESLHRKRQWSAAMYESRLASERAQVQMLHLTMVLEELKMTHAKLLTEKDRRTKINKDQKKELQSIREGYDAHTQQLLRHSKRATLLTTVIETETTHHTRQVLRHQANQKRTAETLTADLINIDLDIGRRIFETTPSDVSRCILSFISVLSQQLNLTSLETDHDRERLLSSIRKNLKSLETMAMTLRHLQVEKPLTVLVGRVRRSNLPIDCDMTTFIPPSHKATLAERLDWISALDTCLEACMTHLSRTQKKRDPTSLRVEVDIDTGIEVETDPSTLLDTSGGVSNDAIKPQIFFLPHTKQPLRFRETPNTASASLSTAETPCIEKEKGISRPTVHWRIGSTEMISSEESITEQEQVTNVSPTSIPTALGTIPLTSTSDIEEKEKGKELMEDKKTTNLTFLGRPVYWDPEYPQARRYGTLYEHLLTSCFFLCS
ncbi:hypothetical protein GMRT_12302 [Giardia muris]|uniref:Uncharacterized protein n=1 Tax=Giardia muris TaxID=5742 RepID=A0A4Z1TDC7_GIAMU|nr:hypothetical protein GMRT_12302 [Giardia muris]|eukprot:TNJ30541.1 hypothetical protein GMRT_12302 [Giardia muris]